MTDDETLAQYLPWLRKVAGSLAGFDSPDLQDLVQEGYIEMWRALRSFQAGKGPLDYWLKFKASNKMKTIAIRARQHPGPDLPGELPDVQAPDLMERLDIAYHQGEIAQAIDRLTPQQKRYVIARFWLGLSGNEMVQLGVFAYDPTSGLWHNKKNGARWKLQEELSHLARR